MEKVRAFELIITILNFGYAGQAMEAAKKAGAHGGTVLNARGTGIREAEKYLGMSIQPEKEVVLILVQREQRAQIMQAICDGAGLNTKGRGLSFSLPVDDVVGVVHLLQED